MITVDAELCTGCRLCAQECPTGGVWMEGRLAVPGEACVDCGLCVRVCPRDAITLPAEAGDGRIQCDHCPVMCRIPEGYAGACARYRNDAGRLVLDRPLLVPAQPGPRQELVLEPLLTAVGAGTSSPCFAPAPYIVEESFAGIDVVTVVSEVPLSYSGMKVKVDTNVFIGEEGARVRRNGRPVGRIETEEYGSKMIALGGVNSFHGKYGSTAARTVSDLCNGRAVELKVEGGARLKLELGRPPLIDGRVPDRMRVGCGSATTAMFAPQLHGVAHEVVILDPDITGLLTEHLAGRALGLTWSGLTPVGERSTVGRYFGHAGAGLGGTDICEPLGCVADLDLDKFGVGRTLFVTDTAGDGGYLFRRREQDWEQLELTDEARNAMSLIRANAQDSLVSGIFVAGVGGSARAGVTAFPIKLNEAVHRGDVRLTVGGAPVFLLPGGGITFMVDVARLPPGAITWVPTPALVAPVEYTMLRAVYSRVEGHLEAIRPRQEVLAERGHRTIVLDAAISSQGGTP